MQGGSSAVSKVEVVVLGLLADEPLHGYQLLERFRARSMGFWVEVGRASVYQALDRLEARGLVTGRAQDSAAGPDRRVFKLSRSGRARLEEGLAERFDDLAPYETGAGTAFGFVGLLGSKGAKEALAERERAVHDLLAALGDERARQSDPRSLALLARQDAFARAELVWLRKHRAVLTR